jgi:cell division protein FtsI/penicillin-binding protein 2
MSNNRITFLYVSFLFWAIIVSLRLFYWQVLSKDKFTFALEKQISSQGSVLPERGKIYANDDFPLVMNEDRFLLYAWTPQITQDFASVLAKIKPIIFNSEDEDRIELLKSNFSNEEKQWFLMKSNINSQEKEKIDQLNISGLQFEQESLRSYPEGSMSAQLLGFLGKDEVGRQMGYFGLEGFYQKQLSGLIGFEKNINGIFKWLEGADIEKEAKNGRDLQLYLDRSVQFIIEEELKNALTRYGAKGGWIVVMDSESGGIIGMASFPNFDPEKYYDYPYEFLSNPVISESFEPGSIFKPLIMAAAINEKLVNSDTKCDICSGPLQIGEYEIKTWNEVYHPGSTMEEVIKNSDNVGMVYVARKLGLEKMLDYLNNYNLTQATGIDLQGEMSPPVRDQKNWYPIDLATSSFGQGIAITPIQFITAFNSLANNGEVVKPRVVNKIISDKEEWHTEKEVVSQPLNPSSVNEITKIMISAVNEGEAKWAKPEGYSIAGKTGTAQIPVGGDYDQEKTIASFIGFAPADKPKFTMLVSLKEPSSSPWGSETAAPLWFSIAQKLFTYYGIPSTN